MIMKTVHILDNETVLGEIAQGGDFNDIVEKNRYDWEKNELHVVRHSTIDNDQPIVIDSDIKFERWKSLLRDQRARMIKNFEKVKTGKIRNPQRKNSNFPPSDSSEEH